MRATFRVYASVAVNNAAGSLKIQAETGAGNGATCRIAETWQRFVASAHVYRAVLRLINESQLHTHSFTVTGALAADVLPVLSTALTVNVFSHTPIKV